MPRCLSDRKIKEKEITIMKKLIKNYLTKLQENDKKGFSLVELIIVMAIMAILVGVVASQVIPYMEKSRQSKDQQQLSSICTNLVSAIAQDGTYDLATKAASADITFELSKANLTTNTSATIESTFAELCGEADTDAVVTALKGSGATSGKFVSQKAKESSNKIYITLKKTGVVQVDLGTAAGSPATAKLQVKSE
jgi:type IV pilus assembly protein PilA